ncbi:MAG: zinc ABC transporter substrate-binding protein [Anaerolineae bacterium]|nr:zinc ABC transporter substrate-binding protein [Anaerolineae bacterium]
MKHYLVIAAALLALLLSGVGMASAQETRLNIVATTTQVTDLTHILTEGVDGIAITGLMGAGVDPHLYQPTISDISAMNAADAVFYSGLHLEGKMGEVLDALAEQGVVTYAVSDPVKSAGYTFGGFRLSDEFTDVDDPHFWFDPRNWQLATEGLADTLAQIDPANAATYSANAQAYIAQLDLLYSWGQEAMAVVPEQQRYLITSHDAFQYFGDAFGWQVRGLQGISTVDEAGVADIQDLASFIVTQGIPVMFIESSVPPDAIEAVQEAVRAAGGTVGIGTRVLYSDAMGTTNTPGGTYLGMLATNIITILQSFGYNVLPFPVDLNLPSVETLVGG